MTEEKVYSRDELIGLREELETISLQIQRMNYRIDRLLEGDGKDQSSTKDTLKEMAKKFQL